MLARVGDDEGPASGEFHLRAVGLARVQVQADELGDVVGGRLAGDLRRGSLLDDAAAFEDQEPVGQHQRFQRVVGDQQARPGEVRQVALELGLHIEAGPGVQGRQGLVQQQQFRLTGQRAPQRHPLRLPAGQLVRLAASEAGQPEPVEPVAGRRPGRPLALAPGARRERHVLGHGQVREEPVVLEDEPDRPPGGLHEGSRVRVVQHLPRQRDAPGGDGGQARHRAEQCGLPGPVRPQQAEDLAAGGGEADREGETAAADLGVEDEAIAAPMRHESEPPRSQWSRRETSTMMETSSSTRLSAIAASGSVSSA